MKQNEKVTTSMVLEKIGEVKDMLAKLREQICADPDPLDGDEIRKHSPQGGLQKAEADYDRAADAFREHNKAGTQEGAEGLAATQQLLKLASLRKRARKEAAQGIR